MARYPGSPGRQDLHGVWPDSAEGQDTRNEVAATIHGIHGLLLDLRGCDYTLGSSGTWRNRATSSMADAEVPSGVEFDDAEKAFVFTAGGDVIRVPIATNPHVLREATYAVWVKVPKPFANLGWLICQYPDHGWSRAVTLNDYRLGHISVTTSRFWDAELGPAPIGEWLHVAGVWHSDGSATVYLNGVRGGTAAVTNNGKSAYCSEELLLIGGRAPNDSAHNSAMLVSDVCIFGRALRDEEVQVLHGRGRCKRSTGNGGLAQTEMSYDSLECFPVPLDNSVAIARPDAKEQPVWDDATRLFWCNTGVDAYDLPEGGAWQKEFRVALEQAAPAVNSRVLVRNRSDPREPGSGRRLAAHPSDPDKRSSRASHTDALRRMGTPAGVDVHVNGCNIALFRFNGRVFAVDAHCPHQGARLCEGEVGDIEDLVDGQRFYVRCKVHKFQFDLTTGVVIDGKCQPLRIYNARVRDRARFIEVGFETLSGDYFDPDNVDF